MRRFLLLFFIANSTSYVLASPETSLDEMRAKQLPPAQLQAIRSIGGNILQAKRAAQVAPSDKTVLNQLRATVGNLLAAEPFNSTLDNVAIRRVGETSPVTQSQTNQQATKNDAPRRISANTEANDLIRKLRQERGKLQGKQKSASKREIYSAGKPIAAQRGRQYEQWAKQLESIVNKPNPERTAELLKFSLQLQSTKSGVNSPTPSRGEPTYQARPWIDPSVANALLLKASKAQKAKANP